MAQKIPLLYENVFGPARVKDTEKTITITLAAGKGVIIDAYAFDAAGNKITKAYAGQGVGLYVYIQNQGDSDYLWCTVKDKDTGAIIVRKDGVALDVETYVEAGTYWGWTAATAKDLEMPAKNWNLLIEAGHGRK
jgi:hypothetical protein